MKATWSQQQDPTSFRPVASKHQRRLARRLPVPCPWCERRFKNEDAVRDHIEAKHINPSH